MVVAAAQKTAEQTRRTETPRHVTVLGSTGSVGRNTVELIARDPDSYVVEALTAGRNVAHLAEQARSLRPKLAVIADPAGYEP
jgi:1-deoxy-D-xylulose-5-phosphate reductoisomerase